MGCEQDYSEDLSSKQSFKTPSVAQAKQHFEQKSIYRITHNGVQLESTTSSTSLQVDFASSKDENYKDTPVQDVDILYTPIYLNTTKNAKAFLASTDDNGVVDSRIIFTLYKDAPSDLGLSAYVFVYDLNGDLDLEYNFDNGQSVPFSQTNTTDTMTVTLNSTIDCFELPTLDVDAIMAWLENCNSIWLDEVVITAYLNNTIDAGPSGGGGFGADISPWVSIDGLGYLDQDPTLGTGGTNSSVFVSNVVVADPISIALALELSISSPEVNWLSLHSQQLLDAIAAYLNNNKAKSPDSLFQNIDTNQLPDIKDDAVDFLIDLINYSTSNPNLDIAIIENAINVISINSNANPIIGADCRSFEFAKPPGSLVRACAVKDMDLTFYTAGIRSNGSPYYGEIDINTSLIHFIAPNWMTNSQAANATALAVTTAIQETDLHFLNNPDISQQNLANFFNSALVTNMASIGGAVSPIAPFPIPSPAPYVSSFFGASTDC